MYHILMCDDNPYILKKFEQSIRAFFMKNHLEHQIYTYQNPQDLLKQASATNVPFLVILDIVMPQINGLQVATQLKASCSDFVLLFLTSSEEYYYDSCALQPLHYLSKTAMSEEELASYLQDAITRIDQLNKANTTYIPSFFGKQNYALKDILYIKIAKDSICLYLKEGKHANEPYQKEEILSYLEETSFYQSKEIILNLENITSIHEETITLETISLSFSSEESKKIKRAYATYIMGR